jgi:hypothetical protein
MKLTNLSMFAIGASLLFASGAFAANEAKGKLRLVEPDGYGSREEADGTRTLTSIFISGKKYDLQAAQNQAEQTPAGATAGNK